MWPFHVVVLQRPAKTCTKNYNTRGRSLFCSLNLFYYMEESVLLGTKPLVDSIRHFIRDPSGVFSVCHLCDVVSFNEVTILLNWFLASRLFSLHIIKRTLHGGSNI